jgi:hypothetical protein
LHAVEEPHGIPIFRLDFKRTGALTLCFLLAQRSLDLLRAVPLLFPLSRQFGVIEVVAAIRVLA